MQLVIRKPNCDGLGNILKGYISALSIDNNAVIECNPDYIYGTYDSILDKKHIFNQDEKYNTNIEKVYTCRLLVLKEEESIQQNIYNEFQYTNFIGNNKFDTYFSSHLIDWNYEPNLIHPKVSDRILQNFNKLCFKPIILEMVNDIYNKFFNNTTLGISVRTWKTKGEINIDRQYNFNTYKNKILEILSKNQDINQIVFSIDNQSYFDEYKIFFEEYNINYLYLEKNNINYLQHSIIKALTLSKCKYFLGNRISTFTELVFWFSKLKSKVYTVF